MALKSQEKGVDLLCFIEPDVPRSCSAMPAACARCWSI